MYNYKQIKTGLLERYNEFIIDRLNTSKNEKELINLYAKSNVIFSELIARAFGDIAKSFKI